MTLAEAEQAVIESAIRYRRSGFSDDWHAVRKAVDALLALRSAEDTAGRPGPCQRCYGDGYPACMCEPAPEQGAPPCACGSVGAYHYPRCLLFREGSTPEGLPPDGTKPTDFELPEESENG